VTGLDPTSRILAECYDEAVSRFVEVPFSHIESRMDEALNIVPNDVEMVKARLKARGLTFP
jgi:hypothetical protein